VEDFVDQISDKEHWPEDDNISVLDASTEVITQAGQWDYSIARQGDLEATFSDENSGEEIVMNFQISDRPYEVFLYKRDCLSSMPVMSFTTATISREGAFKNVSVRMDIDQAALQDATDVWFYDTETKKGILAFCIKMSLGNLQAPGESVNFLETKVNMTVDMAQGFTVENIVTDRDDAEDIQKNETVSYNLEAYQCDSATASPLDPAPILSQGSELEICIKTNSTDVGLADVRSLVLTQEGSTDVNAIVNSKGNGLTASSCEGQICSVKTMLISSFFAQESPSSVDVRGTVVMFFGSSGRRQLVRIAPRRRDLENSNDAADFELQVLLDKSEESAPSQADVLKKDNRQMTGPIVGGGCVLLISLTGFVAMFIRRRRQQQQPIVPLSTGEEDDMAMTKELL